MALAAARQQEMEGMKELSNMESQVFLILIIYPYKDLTLYAFLFPSPGPRNHLVKQRTVDGGALLVIIMLKITIIKVMIKSDHNKIHHKK